MRLPARYMWKVDIDIKLLFSLLIGIFMGALDLTILAPALPHLSSSLEVSPAAVVLAFSIYAAFYAVSVPVMSKLSDVRGYKLIYGTSMVLFAIGSAGAALSSSLPQLVVARSIQGIGGGGLFPVAQAIVGAVVSEQKRGEVLGLLLGAFALGGVLGPNLGGYLVEHLTWQWIFWINVPLGILGTILLVGATLPDQHKQATIDWAGALLVAITFGSLVLGIGSLREAGEHGFFSLQIGGLFALTLLGLALLIPVELRRDEPILNINLITSRAIAPLLLVSAMVGYALLSGIVFVPLYVQIQFGTSSFGAGAVLNAAAAGLVISSWIAGAYTRRSSVRWLILSGMAATTAGLALMILLHMSIWGLLGGLVLVGAGLGLAQAPITFLGLALTPAKDRGQISGLISITRSMGGATGISISGVMLGEASRYLSEQVGPELTTAVWSPDGGLSALRDAPPAVQEIIRTTLGDGIVHGWYWAALTALAGLFVAFTLQKNPQPRQPERSRLGW